MKKIALTLITLSLLTPHIQGGWFAWGQNVCNTTLSWAKNNWPTVALFGAGAAYFMHKNNQLQKDLSSLRAAKNADKDTLRKEDKDIETRLTAELKKQIQELSNDINERNIYFQKMHTIHAQTAIRHAKAITLICTHFDAKFQTLLAQNIQEEFTKPMNKDLQNSMYR